MKEKNYLIFILVALSSFLSSCSSMQPVTRDSGFGVSCVCDNYFKSQNRPSWVDAGDVVTQQIYQSAGSSQCTGMQNIDIDNADLSARTKLGRILNAQVSSNISETRNTYGNGVGSSKSFIKSSLISKAVLENSRIAERWVDPISCTVYSQVQITTSELKIAKDRIAKADAAKLINQSFYIDTTDNDPDYRDLVDSAAGVILSQIGAGKVFDSQNPSAYQIKFTFLATQIKDGKSVRGELLTKIFDPSKSIIWQHTTPAKGVSYNYASNRDLSKKAIDSAMRSLRPILQNRFDK
jgi:predicted small secreted protein